MTIEPNRGYKFYRDVLKSPKLIVAPMVDQSDLPFRELCKRYGAQLGFTPMIHSKGFIDSAKIRDEMLYKCCFDRPLICQFCASDLDTFLKAVELAKFHCDGVDLNLGCPQTIAKKGKYGAFLEDWNLISSMIKQATDKFPDLPITCKIRVFEDEKKTIEFAKMIEKSGCYLLTVHGRTREQKGQFTGLANWTIIKKIKEAVKIPVFANGNIQNMKDIEDCLKFTGVDGIMSAEGLLYNPALFKSLHVPSWILIDEYLEICRKTSIISNVFMKAHLFKMAQQTLQQARFSDLRIQLSNAFKIEEFQAFSNELRKRFEMNENQIIQMTNYPIPHYLSQSYFRPTPIIQINGDHNLTKKHKLDDSNDKCSNEKEKSKNKKLKVKHVKIDKSLKHPRCNDENCLNPRGMKCDQLRCRNCCKKKCFESDIQFTCSGHGFNVKKLIEKSNKTNEKLDIKSNQELIRN